MVKNFQPLIDELRVIIENSRNGRLSPADEQKGAALFKELVTSGGSRCRVRWSSSGIYHGSFQ